MFPAGAPVATAQQAGLTQTDVFAVDGNGALNVLWAQGSGGWQGPHAIGATGALARSASLAVSEQIGLTQTDVFPTDNAGNRTLAYMVAGGNNTWSGPAAIP